MYYVQCKNCGANNDPGETCDCKRERPDYFRTTLKLGISGRWPPPNRAAAQNNTIGRKRG